MHIGRVIFDRFWITSGLQGIEIALHDRSHCIGGLVRQRQASLVGHFPQFFYQRFSVPIVLVQDDPPARRDQAYLSGFNRALRVDIEDSNRFDFLAKQLYADRRSKRRKNINDIAPDTKFTAQSNQGLAGVAQICQSASHLRGVDGLTAGKCQSVFGQSLGREHPLRQCPGTDYGDKGLVWFFLAVGQHFQLSSNVVGAGEHLFVRRNFT